MKDMAWPQFSITPFSGLLFGVLGVLIAVPCYGGDGDYDRARDLYESGNIRGLSEVLRRAGEAIPGDVVGVDLVQQDGIWVYRLDVVQADGHRRVIDISASMGSESADGGSAGR
jgi:uncharacterized membrane protein YkoI